jgi:hypothetical protein
MRFLYGFIFPLIVLGNFTPPDYKWLEVIHGKNYSDDNIPLASDLINQKVYISIATISDRIKDLHSTIQSLLHGNMLANRIYIIISDSAYMKDKGVSTDKIPEDLIEITKKYPVSIVYSENIGPHRKLLPILSKFWNDDCLIITLDDDVKYPKGTLSELINGYLLSKRESVIALRSHRIGLCLEEHQLTISKYKFWPLVGYGTNEILQLPTGTGGVLYRPSFFHPIVFDYKLIKLTSTGDDILFRLATMIKDISVVTGCRVSRDRHEVRVKGCPETYPIKYIEYKDRLSNYTNKKKIIQNLRSYTDKIFITNSIILKNITSNTVNIKHNKNNKNNKILLKYYNNIIKNRTDSDTTHEIPNKKGSNINNRQQQHRRLKEISLWKINKHHKNDKMWHYAIRYIEKKLKLDFQLILDFYFMKERVPCIATRVSNEKYACGIMDKCD